MDIGQLFPKLINNMKSGIYVVDSEKKYIYANDAFLAMINVKREELIGHSVHEFRDKGKYDTCISDYVFHDKVSLAVFGNVSICTDEIVRRERLLIQATPSLDSDGNVEYIYVECELMNNMDAQFREASARNISSAFSAFNTSIGMTDTSGNESQIVAESQSMKRVLTDARNIASVDSTVLISGASGTGKEIIAQYIHKNSKRKNHRMIIINCASVPENLLESIFFGYEKGSFTGGLPGGKQGLIEASHQGTLFLDEINSLPLMLQGKLLRVLETKQVQRIGSAKEISVDFRLIAATNENLSVKIQNGTFRADLYYRLSILPINLPTLEQRREDIIPLVKYYNKLYCTKYNKNRIFGDSTLNEMANHDWPGNIRELKNVVERAVIMAEQEYISPADILQIIGINKDDASYIKQTRGDDLNETVTFYETMLRNHVSLKDYLNNCEKKYLSVALNQCGSSYKTAEALQTNQPLIIRRKEKYGL